MFKLRSIAARLILAISLTVAVACAILGGFSISQQRALTRLALDQQLKLQYDSVIERSTTRSCCAGDLSRHRRVAAGRRCHRQVTGCLGKLLASLGPVKAQGIPLISSGGPAVSFYRIQREAFCDDASPGARPWWNRSRPASRSSASNPARGPCDLRHDPIMRDGKTLANVDVGAAFARSSSTAKQRFGIDLAVHSFTPSFRRCHRPSATPGRDPDELKGVMNGAPLLRDATLTAMRSSFISAIRNYAGRRSPCSRSSRTPRTMKPPPRARSAI